MGLNETPSANRIHIGFFGKTNSGKSSLMNAVCGQQLSVVSEIPGTTTDPVMKAMELLPLGPVVWMDTAGLDDSGKLGEMRMEKTAQVLRKTDVAVLVVDGQQTVSECEQKLAGFFREHKIPFLVAINKADIACDECQKYWNDFCPDVLHLSVSAKDGVHTEEIKISIGQLLAQRTKPRKMVADYVKTGDLVVLVTPIDASAPKGRLILPQQQAIRELLEAGAMTMVVQLQELEKVLKTVTQTPRLVITDSQVFEQVSGIVPRDIMLTSFSILLAAQKGMLEGAVLGARILDTLQNGDKILISEGCTHHRQCGDIGKDKLPAWMKRYTGKELNFEWTGGNDFPTDLTSYRLVVHCGGCMLAGREMDWRISAAQSRGIPMTNYGIVIAHMNGILERSIELYESETKRDQMGQIR